jgi:putative flavoprotein involved in K+ transport
VIWATGFRGDLSWISLPVTAPDGSAIHEQGRSPVPGLWFLGIPWMRTRKSGIIMGADEDGSHTADQVAAYLIGTA